MAEQAPPQEFDSKLVLLGNSGVGKTSLVLRYVQGTFAHHQTSTIGASFMTKRVFIDSWKVKLQLWDTAGQERFRSMTPMYYRGAHAAVLVYDITQEDSLDAVKDWVRELQQSQHNVRNDIIIAIAGNKVDLEEKRKVPKIKAQEYATSIGAILREVSAKDDSGIEELFLQVTKILVEKQQVKSQQVKSQSIKGLPLSPQRKEKCCS